MQLTSLEYNIEHQPCMGHISGTWERASFM